MSYADGTSVSIERSVAEIERLLQRFGASQFGRAWDSESGRQLVEFRLDGRRVRLELPTPNLDDPLVRLTPSGKRRTDAAAKEVQSAETRRRWRSLTLVVKAKLTAVSDGISTLEREFFADLVLPDGRTIHEVAGAQIGAVLKGTAPLLLGRGVAE